MIGVELDRLKRIRSDIMRCFWSTSFYTMNPNLTFVLLVKPHLDPLFAFIYRGLYTVLRCSKSPSYRALMQQRFPQPFVPGHDGPIHRLQAIQVQQPIFNHIINQLVQGVRNPEQWGLELRMIWRNELIHRAARDRPQHFADLAAGCDFPKTLSLYQQWDATLEAKFTEALAMKLGVLRRLLCGGLLTEEVK